MSAPDHRKAKQLRRRHKHYRRGTPMKLEFDVTYTDGTVQHVKVRPKHLVAMEDQGIEIGETAKASFQIAHTASDRPEPFEEWLEEVEDIETITAADVESRPRPTPEESLTSP